MEAQTRISPYFTRSQKKRKIEGDRVHYALNQVYQTLRLVGKAIWAADFSESEMIEDSRTITDVRFLKLIQSLLKAFHGKSKEVKDLFFKSALDELLIALKFLKKPIVSGESLETWERIRSELPSKVLRIIGLEEYRLTPNFSRKFKKGEGFGLGYPGDWKCRIGTRVRIPRELYLNTNEILPFLEEVLEVGQNIQKINLKTSCNFEPLTRGSYVNRSIREVWINAYPTPRKELEYFAEFLKASATLSILCIESWGIDDYCGTRFGAFLKTTTTLTVLRVKSE